MNENDPPPRGGAPSLGVGYPSGRIARALLTAIEHPDPATRARALEKAARWEHTVARMLSGSVDVGSRTPVRDVPAWVTLEVLTGGFASGHLLAGGELQAHERDRLVQLSNVKPGEERRALNGWFLSEAGFPVLLEYLESGRYDIRVPEEGALLVVAWLVVHDRSDEARELVDTLAPHFSTLRFYPVPAEQVADFGPRIQRQTVGETAAALQAMKPHAGVLAQKEAVEIWVPLYDATVALAFETVEHGEVARKFAADWFERATALLDRYAQLRAQHRLCGKPDDPRDHFAPLREFLANCIAARGAPPKTGRASLILERYAAKRGVPGSDRCVAQRDRQMRDVAAPVRQRFVAPVLDRLAAFPPSEGVADPLPLTDPLTTTEAARHGLPAHAGIPQSIRRRVNRALKATAAELIARGIITSGDVLAHVLPQMVAGVLAAGIADPVLRRLRASIYRAFRRRRSLLLVDLQSQVRLEELPWFDVLERARGVVSASDASTERRALTEITSLTLTSFPHAILPNKLLQELRALAKDAGLTIPFVDELAADIFMGAFAMKFVAAAHDAARLLRGSLYARYYGIDFERVLRIPLVTEPADANSRSGVAQSPEFAQLCFRRAGVTSRSFRPAENGMVIEQQQILTTQNLASLWVALDLDEELRDRLPLMARSCFHGVLATLQAKPVDRHSSLIALKNCAYAWRQMLFFLSRTSDADVERFIDAADRTLVEQPAAFRERFRPAVQGIRRATLGPFEDGDDGARQFLGWSASSHWLLPSMD